MLLVSFFRTAAAAAAYFPSYPSPPPPTEKVMLCVGTITATNASSVHAVGVVSRNASVYGNAPPKQSSQRHIWESVCMLGQVPVAVSATVAAAGVPTGSRLVPLADGSRKAARDLRGI
jgi:hypothetical protein